MTSMAVSMAYSQLLVKCITSYCRSIADICFYTVAFLVPITLQAWFHLTFRPNFPPLNWHLLLLRAIFLWLYPNSVGLSGSTNRKIISCWKGGIEDSGEQCCPCEQRISSAFDQRSPYRLVVSLQWAHLRQLSRRRLRICKCDFRESFMW
jgi:hypothetical protein